MEECVMGENIDWNQVAELAEKIKEQGLSFRQGARQYGIPLRRLYELSRMQRASAPGNDAEAGTEKQLAEAGVEAKGEDGPQPEDTGGKVVDRKSPVVGEGDDLDPYDQSSLPVAIQELIVGYRREDGGIGFKRIEDRLKTDHLVVVSRKQIRRVLKNHGLLGEHDSSFDEVVAGGKGSRRFEAAYAGEMYQLDVSYVYLSGLPVQYLVVIVDDYSRFCVGAELCGDQQGETLIGMLHQACSRHGKPGKLLTDQGSGFYSWSARQTMFQQYLDDQRIEHLVGNRHSPQSQGKVERLIQTIKREWLGRRRYGGLVEAAAALARYIRGYNFDRPHQGIGGMRPADRFYGVVAERSRIEAELRGREIDFSKGYCIFKVQEHVVSVVSSAAGLAVYLNGNLLGEVDDECRH
jgi:transposase InsO family protein